MSHQDSNMSVMIEREGWKFFNFQNLVFLFVFAIVYAWLLFVYTYLLVCFCVWLC